ncbi:MAG: Pr6Pr family membrane protein [Sphingobium sp.]
MRGGSATTRARVGAALVALIAAFGLAIQFGVTLQGTGAPASALWTLSRFFTIWTNLLVALVFAVIALGRRVPARIIGGLLLSILLVGIVYGLLLHGLQVHAGAGIVANALLHQVTPIAVPLWWMLFAVKGDLRRADPWLWALYPLAYFAVALVRGAMEGRYPYFFLDIARFGAGQVALNALLIGLCFVAAGYALLWLDRRLSR